MANIITSKTKERARRGRDFFRDHDKGSIRPAFCFPSAISNMREEYEKMEKLLKDPQGVEASHRPVLEQKAAMMRDRLDSIDKQVSEVRKEIKADPDYWDTRRKELQEQIRDLTPSKSDRKLKRVSPWKINKMEKGGEGGKAKAVKLSTGEEFTLSEAKTEFQIISRAMGEDSDIRSIEKE